MRSSDATRRGHACAVSGANRQRAAKFTAPCDMLNIGFTEMDRREPTPMDVVGGSPPRGRIPPRSRADNRVCSRPYRHGGKAESFVLGHDSAYASLGGERG